MCAPEFGSFSGARFSFMREDIIPAAAQRYADTGSAPQITTPFLPKAERAAAPFFRQGA